MLIVQLVQLCHALKRVHIRLNNNESGARSLHLRDSAIEGALLDRSDRLLESAYVTQHACAS